MGRERERNAERLLSLLEELAFLKLKTATSSSGREILLQAPTSHIGEKVQARAAVSETLLHTELPGRAQKQGHGIHLSGNSNTLQETLLPSRTRSPDSSEGFLLHLTTGAGLAIPLPI